MSRQKFSHLNWPWPYFISMVIECRILITLTVAIVVSVEKKTRYLPDKSTKKTHQYQRKGFLLNTWRRNSSRGGNPRHGGRRSGPSSDCCCLCRSVTVETKTRPHRDIANFSACLQNCFLNKHFVIIFSTNKMCAFAYFAIYTLNGNTIEVRFMICGHNIN